MLFHSYLEHFIAHISVAGLDNFCFAQYQHVFSSDSSINQTA